MIDPAKPPNDAQTGGATLNEIRAAIAAYVADLRRIEKRYVAARRWRLLANSYARAAL